jgi:hypothetical protein
MSVKKPKPKKASKPPRKDGLEDLIQDYYNTTHTPAKEMLLKLIQLKDPKFKGDK